jgi:hypothetical protein
MKTLLPLLLTAWCALAVLPVVGVDLPATIASDTSYGPGEFGVPTSTRVLAGATLTLVPATTLRFATVTSSLIVEGGLQADTTWFLGPIVPQQWGQVLVQPGATCVLANCVLDYGGGTQLPPPPESNAVVFARAASVSVSNCVVTRAHGDCFGFVGGNILFVDNVVTTIAPGYGWYAGVALYGADQTPLLWRSHGNVFLGASPRPGIWIEGTFSNDALFAPGAGERLHLAAVSLANSTATFGPDADIGFNDYTPGSLRVLPGSRLNLFGSAAHPIRVGTYYGTNPWPGFSTFAGSTTIIAWTTIDRALSHALSNAVWYVSNVTFNALSGGIGMRDSARLFGHDVTFKGMVNRGIDLVGGSHLFLRQTQFLSNNPPYQADVTLDGSSSVDARFCWWSSPLGPFPYGPYGNEMVATNGAIDVFPWLLAQPGSQTNPPVVRITSHAEPVSIAAAQILVQGFATDNVHVARLVMRNGRSAVALEPAFTDATHWQAQCWLYAGLNPLAVYAYDDEGNVDVAAILVECTGAGAGPGAPDGPEFPPIGTKHTPVGVPFVLGIVAASPSDPAVMTYWAANLPAGAAFDPVAHLFTWTPMAVGTYSNILFFATDGTRVATNRATIIVDPAAAPSIYSSAFPDMYELEPYYYTLAGDDPTMPLDWRLIPAGLPEGMTFSRAGIVGGVPLNVGANRLMPVDVSALNGDGIATPPVAAAIHIYKQDNGRRLRVTSYDLPYTATGATVAVQLVATNAADPLAWYDAMRNTTNLGLSLSGAGVLSGSVAAAGAYPLTIATQDASNRSAAAALVMPIVAPEQRLQPFTGKCGLTVVIQQTPAKARKGTLVLSAMFTPPAGFTLGTNDMAVCRIGDVIADAGDAVKSKLDKKALYMKKELMRTVKIQVVKNAKGVVRLTCAYQKADLRYHFISSGIFNEEVKSKQVTVPVWIRIGNHMMLTEAVPCSVKAKLNKFARATAKW